MKTLEEHDRERRAACLGDGPVFNGISCPDCESQLMDDNPNCMLMSNPPRLSISCPDCGYKDTRVA